MADDLEKAAKEARQREVWLIVNVKSGKMKKQPTAAVRNRPGLLNLVKAP